MAMAAQVHIHHHHAASSSSNLWSKMMKRASYGSGGGIEESDYSSAKDIAKKKIEKKSTAANNIPKKFCLCAPSTHAGSFKCRLHRAPPTHQKSSTLGFNTGKVKNTTTDCSHGNIIKPQVSRFGRAATATAAATRLCDDFLAI